eukprot:GHVN01025866.1.p1 GENE.GHVN01025866.1~~GHVN01025866.1.p1  ORF type:complete len:270 (+),score=41.07 GHVN01025866.1:2026-2835(+)
MQVEEARMSCEAMCAEYERQLQRVEAHSKLQAEKAKQRVLKEFDSLICSETTLAADAVDIAKREREAVKREKLKAQRLAEISCKGFEQELKGKIRTLLDDCREKAQKAQRESTTEAEELKKKCSELEMKVDKSRQDFEAEVVREAERKISTIRHEIEQKRAQQEHEIQNNKATFDRLINDIESEVASFEAELKRRALQVLWDKGVDITEQALDERLDILFEIIRDTDRRRATEATAKQKAKRAAASRSKSYSRSRAESKTYRSLAESQA